ncbi:DNRLRE domain-containing protein [Sphaerisporangium sp. NPDC051011]|uniref:fibronectin type III domain-containing protein n=1 Tax=Sphaerisporangium sp. NPDC051011 TaxID=3155792 RepID=UPI0033CE4FEB
MLTAAATMLSVIGSLLTVVGGVTPAAAQAPNASKPPANNDTVTMPTPAGARLGEATAAHLAASAEAKELGKPVEVITEASETSSTWALPDGDFTTDFYTGPMRVKQADGSWRWIDTTLIEENGVLKPRVSKADVQLSLGGDKPFATLRSGNGSYGLRWGSPLPRPLINGATATYSSAAGPGADLVVTALPTGLAHDVVLRERPSGPLEIRLPLDLSGAQLTKSDGTQAVKVPSAGAERPQTRKPGKGQLLLTDKDGALIASAPQPMMWDNATELSQKTAKRRAQVATSIEKGKGGPVLVLRPDPQFLADPATTYPVRVDPTMTIGLTTDAWVAPDFPGSNSGSNILNVGNWGDNLPARSYVQFGIESIRGVILETATLNFQVQSQSTCSDMFGPPNPQLFKTRRVTSAWTTTGLDWSAQPATTEEDAGIHTTCGPINFPITNMVKKWLTGTANYGVQIVGTDESLKRYVAMYSNEINVPSYRPKLVVNYNMRPSMPEVTVSEADSLVGDHVIVRNPQSNVGFKSTSQDGGALGYEVNVYNSCCPQPSIVTISGKPSGQVTNYQFGLANPDSWRFQVRACRLGTCSDYTPWYRITADAGFLPTDLATGLTDPASPVLSGVVSRPSGGMVAGRFYLFDSAGNPVGPSPIGEVSVNGGERVSVALPVNTVQAGATYSWRMRSCIENSCSPDTSPITFTVPTTDPDQPPQRVTIGRDKLTIKAGKSAADACAGSPCALETSPQIQVGGDAGEKRLSLVKADVGSIPSGARISSAILDLGSPACQGTSCSQVSTVEAWHLEQDLPSSATGADVNAALGSESAAVAQSDMAQLDITGLVQEWLKGGSANRGVVLQVAAPSPVMTFGESQSASAPVLTVEFTPPAPPGKVSTLAARAGDAGLLISWQDPDDYGADVENLDYDVQVLDAGNNVVQSHSLKEAMKVITGLANGATYTVKVRARTGYGTGPWEAAGPVTPQAVAGGMQKYIDAASAFFKAKGDVAEGRRADVGEAAASTTQRSVIERILWTHSVQLAVAREEDPLTRVETTTGIVFNQMLASQLPDGSVVLWTDVSRKITTVGSTSEETQPIGTLQFGFSQGGTALHDIQAGKSILRPRYSIPIQQSSVDAGAAAALPRPTPNRWGCEGMVDRPHRSSTNPSVVNVHADARCTKAGISRASVRATLYRHRWWGWEQIGTRGYASKVGLKRNERLRAVANWPPKRECYNYKGVGEFTFYANNATGYSSGENYNTEYFSGNPPCGLRLP